jgi:hypothetical protein
MKRVRNFLEFNESNNWIIKLLETDYPVKVDDFYPTEFGKRFYVMMDDKPSYFTINKNGEMTGNNNVKQAIVRDMEDKGLLNNSNRQEITSGVAEYLRGYK